MSKFARVTPTHAAIANKLDSIREMCFASIVRMSSKQNGQVPQHVLAAVLQQLEKIESDLEDECVQVELYS